MTSSMYGNYPRRNSLETNNRPRLPFPRKLRCGRVKSYLGAYRQLTGRELEI